MARQARIRRLQGPPNPNPEFGMGVWSISSKMAMDRKTEPAFNIDIDLRLEDTGQRVRRAVHASPSRR